MRSVYQRRSCIVAALLASSLFLPSNADAALILDINDFSVRQGHSVDVIGTISLGAGDPGDVTLDSLSITLAALGLTVDASPFFVNSPASLAPSEATTAVLFSVTADVLASVGSSVGSATLFGTGALGLVESTSDFSVTVQAAPDETPHGVPEPGSLTLLALGSGLASIGLGRSRRRQQPELHHGQQKTRNPY